MKSHSLLLAFTALLLALLVISEDTTAAATKTIAVASVDAAALTELPVAKAVNPEVEATTASPSKKDENNSGGDRVDDAAGAEGADDGAFKLSKGGMAAIIVVVVVVAGGGIVSTVLFFLAKKRQWELRDKLKRASRRVATRLATPRSARFPHREHECQQGRKPGVRVASPSPRPGTKGGAKERDLEKGEKRGVNEKGKPTMSAFDVETPKVTWKDRLFGYK